MQVLPSPVRLGPELEEPPSSPVRAFVRCDTIERQHLARKAALGPGSDSPAVDLLRRKGVVKADRGALGMHDAEVSYQVLGPIPCHDHHKLPGLQTDGPKAQRDGSDLIPVLALGETSPALRALPTEGLVGAVILYGVRERIEQGASFDYAIHHLAFRQHVPTHPDLLSDDDPLGVEAPNPHEVALNGF
jgi:hypothetical protein